MSSLQIGWAETVLLPEPPAAAGSPFAARLPDPAARPVTATALAAESGDQIVVVSADLGVLPGALTDAVRFRLAGNRAGLDPMKVLFCAAPGLSGREPRGDCAELFGPLAERLAGVALKAWTGRSSGFCADAAGRPFVNRFRRVVSLGPSGRMQGDTDTAVLTRFEGGKSAGMELLYLYDERKELSGIAAALGRPVQCVQHRRLVPPDCWAEARMLLRRHFGGQIFLLGICSAAGDADGGPARQGGAPERKTVPAPSDPAGLRKAGSLVADEIIRMYEQGPGPLRQDIVLNHRVDRVRLPVSRMIPFHEAAAARCPAGGSFRPAGAPALRDFAEILRRFEQQEGQTLLDAEEHTLLCWDQ